MARKPGAPRVDPSSARTREPVLARVLGLLLTFGGVLVLVSLLLPHPSGSDDARLIVVDGAAFAIGGACLAAARIIPRWLLHAALGACSVLICSAVYFSGLAAGLYATMLMWVVLFSAYFFSRRSALVHLGLLLGGYAIVLALVDDAAGYSPLTRWLLTAIALCVASGLTSWLVARGQRAEERSERFFDLSRDMLCTANRDGYFVELNPAWTETLGYSAMELRARPFLDFVHPDDRERTTAEAARMFEGETTVAFENRYQAKDGSWHWLMWSGMLSPQQGLVYARATDVTERKRLEAEREDLVTELDSQARTDPLTELPNRRWLADELAREMARAKRQDFDLCLALVDLDHFKSFNDRHGHGAGDQLLRDATDSWRTTMRVSDFLARYGGEEFIVLLPDCSPASARRVIERLRAATPRGETCSAGIALWDHAEDAAALIARADSALYAAKAAGRDQARMADLELPAGI